VVANTLTIFDRAYNKGEYGISAAALYNLVTVEAVNEEANQALTAMGISPTVKDCKDKEKEGSHTAKMDAMCQRALRMIPAPLRTVVTKAHTLKYGNPTQKKANLVPALEEWEEIKKNRAEMQSTATRGAWKRGCYDHVDFAAAHERGCYDHVDCTDRFEWAAGAAASREQNRSYCNIQPGYMEKAQAMYESVQQTPQQMAFFHLAKTYQIGLGEAPLTWKQADETYREWESRARRAAPYRKAARAQPLGISRPSYTAAKKLCILALTGRRSNAATQLMTRECA
jgi:hypothetical protein